MLGVRQRANRGKRYWHPTQIGDLRVDFDLNVCMFIYFVENAHLVNVYAFRRIPIMFYVQNACPKSMFMACTDENFLIRKGKKLSILFHVNTYSKS